jgi:hypothetical protein
MSYEDHIDFGIVVDRDMVDDAWSLMSAHRRALDELDAVICGTRVLPSKHALRSTEAPSARA